MGPILTCMSEFSIYHATFCLQKRSECFSTGHLRIVFNSFLFFILGAYGWLNCVGPCQRPSITQWCPAELEIHSAGLSPQNEKTRARENKVGLRVSCEVREGRGSCLEEKKNEIPAPDMEKDRQEQYKKENPGSSIVLIIKCFKACSRVDHNQHLWCKTEPSGWSEPAMLRVQ